MNSVHGMGRGLPIHLSTLRNSGITMFDFHTTPNPQPAAHRLRESYEMATGMRDTFPLPSRLTALRDQIKRGVYLEDKKLKLAIERMIG